MLFKKFELKLSSLKNIKTSSSSTISHNLLQKPWKLYTLL
ncbi:protein of unknown function [Bartonella clarridgeiae 73]|uniref:Uncharacterized protein n=1 Tax=Bartonella clarridgeiae (strain CCUG 45776 / CIP 104772 / 73) TaxID=696125 RepID=E6YJD5_BARC7|nr:protein of unknown function [Bartonella clarridgeiae 73]